MLIPLIEDIEIELFGSVIEPPLTVKPLLNVCSADHVFAADRDAPPDDKPDIQVEGIEPDGNVIVPDSTTKPFLNVGVALTITVFVDVVPSVVLPDTVNVVSFSVEVVSVPVIVIFVNVCVPVQVLAADKDTLFNPLIALVDIELFGSVIEPALTVKPLLNVCNAVHVFAVDKDAPPDDKPDIQVEGIEPVGNVIVPPLTVKPAVNVFRDNQLFVVAVLGQLPIALVGI